MFTVNWRSFFPRMPEEKADFAFGDGSTPLHVCAVVCAPYVCSCHGCFTHCRPSRIRFIIDRTHNPRLTVPTQIAALGWQPDSIQASRTLRGSVNLAIGSAFTLLPICLSCVAGTLGLVLLYAVLLASVLLSARLQPCDKGAEWQKAAVCDLDAPRMAALTRLRATLMLQTIFCILAVDFPLLPRSLAKTRTFGHSVMDLGVGAFVLMGTLTRHRAGQSTSESHSPTSTPRASPLVWRVLSRHGPLLALGVGRLAAVRAVDYHSSHSEYGVHWNFFFTLSGVAVAESLLVPSVDDPADTCATAKKASTFGRRRRHPWKGSVLGALILMAHQWALSYGGLSEFVLHAPRTSFVSANKEGLGSLPGFLGIALMGSAFRDLLRPRGSLEAWRAALRQLAALDVGLWALALAADALVQPASRRLCNLAYALWVLAQVLLALLGCLLVSLRCPLVMSPLLETTNRSPLSAFLLANVLTGLVNLTIPTMHASSAISTVVLVVYMSTVVSALYFVGSWNMSSTLGSLRDSFMGLTISRNRKK